MELNGGLHLQQVIIRDRFRQVGVTRAENVQSHTAINSRQQSHESEWFMTTWAHTALGQSCPATPLYRHFWCREWEGGSGRGAEDTGGTRRSSAWELPTFRAQWSNILAVSQSTFPFSDNTPSTDQAFHNQKHIYFGFWSNLISIFSE